MSKPLNWMKTKIAKVSTGFNIVEFWAVTTNLKPIGTGNNFLH